MAINDVLLWLHESKELRWRILLLFAFAVGSLMISMGVQDESGKTKWYQCVKTSSDPSPPSLPRSLEQS